MVQTAHYAMCARRRSKWEETKQLRVSKDLVIETISKLEICWGIDHSENVPLCVEGRCAGLGLCLWCVHSGDEGEGRWLGGAWLPRHLLWLRGHHHVDSLSSFQCGKDLFRRYIEGRWEEFQFCWSLDPWPLLMNCSWWQCVSLGYTACQSPSSTIPRVLVHLTGHWG